jgi:hypothetical protein
MCYYYYNIILNILSNTTLNCLIYLKVIGYMFRFARNHNQASYNYSAKYMMVCVCARAQCAYPLMKMEQCSETSAYNIQTLDNHQK